MNTTYLKLIGIAAFSVLSGAAMAGDSSNIPVTQLHYGATGVSDGVHGELNAAPAYGDLGHGPHGTFIKMPAGFVSPVHTHSEDYWGVVISGVAVNGKPGSTDVQLPVGSYWFQKAMRRTPNECIFFVSQGGKFDYIPAKQGAMTK